MGDLYARIRAILISSPLLVTYSLDLVEEVEVEEVEKEDKRQPDNS